MRKHDSLFVGVNIYTTHPCPFVEYEHDTLLTHRRHLVALVAGRGSK
jgi:hypothetical protein